MPLSRYRSVREPNNSVPVVTGAATNGVNPPGLLANAGTIETRNHPSHTKRSKGEIRSARNPDAGGFIVTEVIACRVPRLSTLLVTGTAHSVVAADVRSIAVGNVAG